MNLMPAFDDDSEPLDPAERFDAAYGSYHIGLCDRDRSEFALVFDARWIPTPNREAQILARIVSVLEGHEAIVRRVGWYGSPERTLDQVHAALMAELVAIRLFDFPEDISLYVAVVELRSLRAAQVIHALKDFQPFAGHANISWPSELRTIMQTALPAV